MIRNGMPLAQLNTPALLIDLKRVEANLARGITVANAAGVALRPHTKTHKSPYFARRQLMAGAHGLTVAKVSEAEVFAEAGFDDLFIANTIYGAEKARRVRRLAERVSLAVGVDHIEQVRAFSHAMERAGAPLAVMIEVDTGARRGGVDPQEAAALAGAVAGLPGLAVKGVYTYEGYTYSAPDRAALVATERQAQAVLIAAGQAVGEAAGVVPVISAGSTPGLLSGAGYLPGITEIRPGTYIFLDAAQADLAGGLEHCAATVLATVVSRPRPDRAILDAGSKALTSDVRAGGVCKTTGHGLLPDFGLVIARLSEEHGVIEGPGVERLAVGQKVRVVPNHICPVVNLFNEMVLIRDGLVVDVLPVAARGRLQ
ncbi:MAG TPA: alanine racemase [Symbiobacteriaceae bacterium]|jgi:D-serine deaminase-like pyridoxal phosphate-dependent protein